MHTGRCSKVGRKADRRKRGERDLDHSIGCSSVASATAFSSTTRSVVTSPTTGTSLVDLEYHNTPSVAASTLDTGKAHQIPSRPSPQRSERKKAVGNCRTQRLIKASDMDTNVLPAPVRLPPIATWIPMKPHVGAEMRRNSAPSSITAGSPGINAATITSAQMKVIKPAAERAPKAIHAPTFVV